MCLTFGVQFIRIGTVGDFVRSHALQQMIKGNLLSRYSKLFLHLNQRYCAVVVCSVQSQCKPNAERVKLACMSYAEVQPDLAKQSQCKPNAERVKLACMSYAEVQPDLAKQSQCKPNAERVKLACMSYAEVQPDLAKQSKNTSIELYKIILNTYLYV